MGGGRRRGSARAPAGRLMGDHFREIYSHRAAAYHRMIAMEDADGHLAAFLRERLDGLSRRRVLDLGGGTGRFGLLLAGQSDQFLSVDLHEGMLRQQAAVRPQPAGCWSLVQGDMRRLPVVAGWADLILAGWSLGHFTGWYPATWRAEMSHVLREIERAAAPGALICIFETMTTGGAEPAPPTPDLAAYYDWLESDWGFSRSLLATDYQFESAAEAAAAPEFFFGPALAGEIRRRRWARLPEWTGAWTRRQPASITQTEETP